MNATPRVAAPFRRRVSAIAVLLTLLAVPAIVVASHQFNDVPNSHTFHGAIGEFAGAGITAGCGGGNFCPDDPVTRGQMAAFMNRGLPRTALATGGVSFEDAADTYVAVLTLETGGTTGGTGYLVVEADVTAWTDDADTCPCELAIWIDMLVAGSDPERSDLIFFDIQNTPMPTGYRNAAGSVSWVFEVPTSTNQTLAVGADISMTGVPSGTGDEVINAILTATYVPFAAAPLSPGSVDPGTRGERQPKTLRP